MDKDGEKLMKNRVVEPLILEIDGLCEALKVGKNTAYELLNNGEIDCFKVGSCWKIPISSVEDYINRKCKERKKDMVAVINNK